jgi:hypothetical protein
MSSGLIGGIYLFLLFHVCSVLLESHYIAPLSHCVHKTRIFVIFQETARVVVHGFKEWFDDILASLHATPRLQFLLFSSLFAEAQSFSDQVLVCCGAVLKSRQCFPK